MMSIDEQQIRALAFLAARVRPRGAKPWDEAGIAANVRKVAHVQLAEVVMATIRAAANDKADSPGVIPNLGGEHWREKVAPTTAKRPPRISEECHYHPGQFADNCGGCHADELAGDEKPPARTNRADPTTGAAACRAALKEGA